MAISCFCIRGAKPPLNGYIMLLRPGCKTTSQWLYKLGCGASFPYTLGSGPCLARKLGYGASFKTLWRPESRASAPGVQNYLSMAILCFCIRGAKPSFGMGEWIWWINKVWQWIYIYLQRPAGELTTPGMYIIGHAHVDIYIILPAILRPPILLPQTHTSNSFQRLIHYALLRVVQTAVGNAGSTAAHPPRPQPGTDLAFSVAMPHGCNTTAVYIITIL